MGILDQIANHMHEKVISRHGFKIDYFSVAQTSQSDNLNYFINLLDKENRSIREQFTSKEEMKKWLTGRGFKIYVENKS